MIDCAIYQAHLPGKSDKRNIYLQSSASKPSVIDEHTTEGKINMPDTVIWDTGIFTCKNSLFCQFPFSQRISCFSLKKNILFDKIGNAMNTIKIVRFLCVINRNGC